MYVYERYSKVTRLKTNHFCSIYLSGLTVHRCQFPIHYCIYIDVPKQFLSVTKAQYILILHANLNNVRVDCVCYCVCMYKTRTKLNYTIYILCKYVHSYSSMKNQLCIVT